MKFRLRLLLETLLWFSGSILIVVSLVNYSMAQTNSLQAVGKLQAQFTLHQASVDSPVFEAVSADAETEIGAALPVRPDQSLWSTERIAAYNAVSAEPDDGAAGLLEIPGLDLLAPVYLGASDINMNRGLGWIEGTARPGDSGNLGIAGHRDGFFRPLKDIQLEQVVILRTSRGEVTYRVKSLEIVEPDAVEVLEPTGDNRLTLVTCYPFYYIGSAPQRFIVKAVEI